MMKKYAVLAALLAAALCLSACGTEDKSLIENGVETFSQTTAENAPEENSEENSENEPEESEGEPEDNSGDEIGDGMSIEEVIAAFPEDSFTAPDGTEVKLTEAVSALWENLCFDFGYIRYAQPVYSDTTTNPELYDFENFEFAADVNFPVEATPIRVEKGQVLDNGMTVKDASYMISPPNYVMMNTVELEGEITLEGLLFCFFEEEYGFDQDEVIFYPDPTSGTVPLIFYSDYPYTKSEVDLYGEFAFVCDCDIYRLGSIDEVGSSDWFKDGSYVRAEVTIENLMLEHNDSFGVKSRAEIKSIELLD